MKLKPIALMVSSVFALATTPDALAATDLPSNVKAVAQSAGIKVESDGSWTFNGTKYVTLIPQNYNASQPVTGDPVVKADGSIVWGNLQFAPVVQTPGEMPHFPDNLVPLSGNTLPPDFQPPKGFVASSSLPLPTGVTVPPLTNADLVKTLVDAKIIPDGVVTFNSDGTVAVKGGSNYLPFLPSTSQQGLAKSATSRGMTVDAKTGAITFPDGSTYAPLVDGTSAGSKTLPKDFTPPSDVSLPSTAALPMQFEIPKNVQIPSGMTLPPGVVIPDGYKIPTGTTLPAGVTIPSTVTLPAGVTVPKGITLPAGTSLATGAALPQGTTVLPSGEVVIPGDKIPTGVTVPTTWTPPTGTTKGADGSMTLPTMPSTGFAQPPDPVKINADGSIVMPALAAGQTLPTGAKLNSDGTYTMPAPSFIGSVGSGGTVQAPSFGTTMPTGFTPQVTTGVTLPGAGAMPSGCTVKPTGTLAGLVTGSFAACPQNPADCTPPSGGGGGTFTPPTGTTTPPTGTTTPPTGTTTPPTGTTTPPTGSNIPPGMTAPPTGANNPMGGFTC